MQLYNQPREGRVERGVALGPSARKIVSHKLYSIFKSNSFHQRGHVLSNTRTQQSVSVIKVSPPHTHTHTNKQKQIRIAYSEGAIRGIMIESELPFNFSHDKFIEI